MSSKSQIYLETVYIHTFYKTFFRLHLSNHKNEEKLKKKEEYIGRDELQEDNISYVSQFGFHVPTSCGRIPQTNTWCDDWVVSWFYCPLQIH